MPELNLHKLLSSIEPHLSSKQYQFCTVTEEQLLAIEEKPIAVFREQEAVTAIFELDHASKHDLNGNGPWSLITCSINSDLNAVGFLAAMTTHLASHKISVNAFSAYYHDHLFVPSERADKAMDILKELSENNQ